MGALVGSSQGVSRSELKEFLGLEQPEGCGSAGSHSFLRATGIFWMGMLGPNPQLRLIKKKKSALWKYNYINLPNSSVQFIEL